LKKKLYLPATVSVNIGFGKKYLLEKYDQMNEWNKNWTKLLKHTFITQRQMKCACEGGKV
jgi:hypothetical protein